MRRLAVVASIGTVVVVGLGGCAAAAPDAASVASSAPSERSAPSTAPATPAPSAPPSTPAPAPAALPVGQAPASVTIPSIGLREPLIELGIDPAGAMEVPADPDRAGWFTGGGRPGGIGPTVIAGHVDSRTGPAVFIRLDELRPGARVQVTDVTGTVSEYEVYRATDHAKADFPTAEVFGATLDDELRLITCGGVFDSASGHYEDNRVVWAERVA